MSTTISHNIHHHTELQFSFLMKRFLRSTLLPTFKALLLHIEVQC